MVPPTCRRLMFYSCRSRMSSYRGNHLSNEVSNTATHPYNFHRLRWIMRYERVFWHLLVRFHPQCAPPRTMSLILRRFCVLESGVVFTRDSIHKTSSCRDYPGNLYLVPGENSRDKGSVADCSTDTTPQPLPRICKIMAWERFVRRQRVRRHSPSCLDPVARLKGSESFDVSYLHHWIHNVRYVGFL